MTNSATSHLLPVFARVDLGFERGEGAWLVATNGERYLDFTSGVAVNALGHAHPKVADAIAAQAHKAIHVSNLAHIDPQTNKPTRIGYKLLDDGRKVRVARRSGEVIDK